MKKGRPINVRNQFIEGLICDDATTRKPRNIDPSCSPINARCAFSCPADREEYLSSISGTIFFTQAPLIADVLINKVGFQFVAKQRPYNSCRPGGIKDMDRRAAIIRGNLHRGMSTA